MATSKKQFPKKGTKKDSASKFVPAVGAPWSEEDLNVSDAGELSKAVRETVFIIGACACVLFFGMVLVYAMHKNDKELMNQCLAILKNGFYIGTAIVGGSATVRLLLSKVRIEIKN